jgi:predicted O-methyltransferase YrrM
LSQRNAIIEALASTPEAKREGPWTNIDLYTAEIEVLYLLYALVKCMKPRRILETGSYHGYSAVFMGQGCRENEWGDVDTIEKDQTHALETQKLIDQVDLRDTVKVWNVDSMDFIPPKGSRYDFVFLDSLPELRKAEFDRFDEWISGHALVLFHDARTTGVIEQIDKIKRLKGVVYIWSARGVALCQKIGY